MEIDLTREHVMPVEAVLSEYRISRRTLTNWFRQGLEKAGRGRKVFTTKEALQRFLVGDSRREPRVSPLVNQRDHERCMNELRAMGML